MKQELANYHGKQVTLCNRAYDEGDDMCIQINVLGILENHDDGYWYVRTTPENLGSHGVSFREEMVMEVTARPSGRGTLIVTK